MIELGDMHVRDHASVGEARLKVLGVVAALGGDAVLATRVATGVSEVARRAVASGTGTRIGVGVVPEQGCASLVLRFEPAPAGNTGIEAGFFHRVRDAGGVLVAETTVQGATSPDARWVERERERVARKSRDELMDELRLKNRELEGYNANLERTVAQRTAELRAANETMRRDLEAGVAYVRALIPRPMRAPVSIDWRYVPSSDLGGDTIGYHAIDEEHLALYLIDVTGHGLDSALLAVTVTNVIRSGSLPGADMRRPGEVVGALNNAFQGERHGLKYFTIWYGVYHVPSRRLAWSGGGHHPAMLFAPGSTAPLMLGATGPIMGAVPDMEFPAEECSVAPGARFLLFSDGVFEIVRDDQIVWNLEGATAYLSRHAGSNPGLMDALLQHVRTLRGCATLDDDFSIIDATMT